LELIEIGDAATTDPDREVVALRSALHARRAAGGGACDAGMAALSADSGSLK
jgi:hypothetical protein